MRINHNIAALNTYGRLSNNQAIGNKALEKLSSGLRINRAGDDAAGLAISEKMRAQVRGLDQASRNAQDGISLIQTAEGALSETHSILQRMRELANQAANDTNVAVDREEIQKEINQLTSEINRIGNTTEFNTRTLLNGETNVIASVTAKLTGGQVAANFAGAGLAVIDAPTQAAATGETVSGTIELLSETGSTATGTQAYGSAVGPDTNLTAAKITGTALAGNVEINDGGGKTLTGTAVYTDPALFNSGPNVARTAGTATGTSLNGVNNLMISDEDGATVTGTKAYANYANNDTGPNVTAADNELTVTLNGVTKTVTLAVANYGAGADDGAADFAADIETKLNDVATGFGAGTFSVGFDAQNKIVITALGDNSGVPHVVSIDGGGTATEHLLTDPSDSFVAGTQAVNNTVELNIGYANGDPDRTRIVLLDNAAYDITVAAGKNDLLADINDSLQAAQIIGENAISTNAVLGVNAGTSVTITINDNGGGDEVFTLNQAALDGLFDGTQTAQEVADAINALNNGDAFTDFARAIVHNGKLVITSNTGAAASTAQFAITDGSGGADLTAIQNAFGINNMAAAVTGTAAPAVAATFDANNRLVFTAADAGEGSAVNIVSGTALASIGLDNAVEVAGTENNELIISFDGGLTTAKISLALADYSSGDDDGADTFAGDIQAKIRALDADALGLNGVTNAQLNAIEVTVNDAGQIEFNTKDSAVNLSITTGVASSGSIDVNATGKNVVLNAGQSGAAYNDIQIDIVADAGNAGNSASMSGNTITVKIGTATVAGDAITTATIQELIRGASGATVDLSKFTVTGDDTLTKTNWTAHDFSANALSDGTEHAGGLETLLKATPADAYAAGTEEAATNQLTITANGIERTLTLTDTAGTPYDVSTGAGQAALVADIQAQLDNAFGADVITASFDGGLVFTNSVEGEASTFGLTVTGNGAANLNLDSAAVEQGGEFNKLTITYEGNTQTLELDKANYDGTAGKTTNDFLADIQAKIDAAFGANNITVSLDNSDKIMFTTKAAGENISIDGGGAVNHLLANPADQFVVDLTGEGNNNLTLTVGAITKTIEITAGNYDLDNAGDRDLIVNDLNTKLDAAFGAGNIVASFNADKQLVLTNQVEGASSTIGANFTGGVASALNIDAAAIVQGLDANNATTLTIDNKKVEITLTAGSYNTGGMASELQNQIRAVEGLEKAMVTYQDGSFVITSGAEGSTGEVVSSDTVLGRALGLTESAGAATTEGVDAVEDALKLQIGANTAQSISIDINDMRSEALNISGGEGKAGATVKAKNGTEAKYVSVANVTDGTDNKSIEYALDVSNHENATAAISVINDAIEAVSAERSKLGAFQNRLEHTINNLGTSSENLTAAESRIRDVDMAKEMMEFTKMNILSQAAQAMLAQANQQPQGVLQLLR